MTIDQLEDVIDSVAATDEKPEPIAPPIEYTGELSLEEIVSHLGDRWWRLNNLYYIKDENGNRVLFKPEGRAPQKELHDNFWYFTIVPKARQLGITTFYAILYLDAVLFSENKTAGIIAHRQEDMKKIFRDKIKFAWENLHPWLRAKIGEPVNDSANELVWPSVEQGGNGGAIFVSMSTRSGTIQYLHISEFGKICAKFPEKAEEIVTGAINSVHAGNVVSIESTAEGREGYFFDFCMDAERARKEGRELTPLDFKIFFFPWWIDPKYTLEGTLTLHKEAQDYFEMLERVHGIKLTTGQKNWYTKKKAVLKDKMFQEFPSTLDECFQVQTEGSYYAHQMGRVYLENRIKPILHEPGKVVDTWWDLGMNDFMVILLTQTVNGKIRFIDMYWNHGHSLEHYYKWLEEGRDHKGYRYGTHNFPHDIDVQEMTTGKTRKQVLWDLGMRNIRVAPKTDNVNEDIELVRNIFSKFEFDEEKCKKLYDSLFNYRKAFDDKLGVFRDKPLHNEASHFADPVRVLARLWRDVQPLLSGEGTQVEETQAFFG